MEAMQRTEAVGRDPRGAASAAHDADVPGDARAAVDGLRALVRREHYDTVYRLHRWELAPRTLDASLQRTAAHAPPATRDLLRLFSFGEALAAPEVERLFGSRLAGTLLDAGLLVAKAGGVVARHRLEVVDEQLLLTDWPAARATGVYFGEDSEFLRALISPRPGDACLDLCTGSGVQALRCAPLASRVDAVDRNPAAARLARLNALLNEVDDRVHVHEGDLWNPLPADARFDHVTCNPPLVPVPDAVEYPLCGHGGGDGLDVVRRILVACPERLTSRGRLTLIGACTGTADAPAVRELVAGTVGGHMDATVFLLLRTTLRDWARMLGDTVAALRPGASAANTVLRCRTHYGPAFDTTWVYTFLLLARADGGTAGCRVVDYTSVSQRSYWFVNRGRVVP